MKTKELPIIAIVAAPFIYLSYIWNKLPKSVPMHYNIHGEIDRYGSKMELLIIPILLPLLTYGIMSLVPKIDPKKQIENMGKKYDNLKFVLVAFMSLLATYIIYTSGNPGALSGNLIVALMGGLFMILGNYMKTIKENYFVGIRTPWTLENPSIWKETHKLAGYLWVGGGLIVLVSCLFLTQEHAFILMMVVTAIISIVPIIHSYLLFKKL